MDDRVQQCPNCGSAVLPSARFCVTCGIRLPDPPGGTGNADATPKGWAQSQPAEDVWIGEAPALDNESEQRLTEEFQRDQQSAIPETGSVEPANNETVASDDMTSEEVVIALPPAEPGKWQETPSAEPIGNAGGSADTGVTDATFDRPAADVGHALGGEYADDAGEEDRPESNDYAGEIEEDSEPVQVGPEGELTDLVSEANDSDATSDTFSWPITGEQAASTFNSGNEPDDLSSEPDDFEPAGWGDSDDGADEQSQSESVDMDETNTAINEVFEPEAASQSGSPVADQAGDLDRATALLDELRDLLPRLAAPTAPAESAGDLAAVRERALAARGDRCFDGFAALREVVNDAVNRPRDIEVVLRLSQRIDDINALIKERDRLDEALTDLTEALNQ